MNDHISLQNVLLFLCIDWERIPTVGEWSENDIHIYWANESFWKVTIIWVFLTVLKTSDTFFPNGEMLFHINPCCHWGWNFFLLCRTYNLWFVPISCFKDLAPWNSHISVQCVPNLHFMALACRGKVRPSFFIYIIFFSLPVWPANRFPLAIKVNWPDFLRFWFSKIYSLTSVCAKTKASVIFPSTLFDRNWWDLQFFHRKHRPEVYRYPDNGQKLTFSVPYSLEFEYFVSKKKKREWLRQLDHNDCYLRVAGEEKGYL